MRINKIKFFNINSLKGMHEISFNEDPLLTAGLYAITGPTGSGKSTILDVITLALYNRVPRLGKITKSNIEKMGSIVTHYTDEAWAEVEFSSNKKEYRSRWSISTARTGNLRDYEMDIVQLPEEKSLGIKKSDVPSENETIIGLSYDQFMKSMLLSQGDFSKFLIARKEERAKLLEEITGTQIYREIGKLAFEKIKDKKQEVDKIQSQIDIIKLLSEEEINLIKDTIDQASKNGENKEKHLQLLRSIIQLQQSSAQLENKKADIEAKETKLNELQKAFIKQQKTLKIHEEIKPFESDILELKQTIKQLDNLQRETQQVKLQISQLKENKALSIQKMSIFIDNEVNEDDFYDKMASFEKEVNELDSQLTEIKNQGSELRARINKLISENESNLNHVLHGKIDAKDAIGLIRDRISQMLTQDSDSPEKLREKWEAIQSKKQILSEYEKLYKEYDRFRDLLKSTVKTLELKEKEIKTFESQLKTSSAKEKNLRLTLEKLKKEHQLAIKEAKLEDFRSELKDGDPCPLCGAIHHPFAHKTLSNIGQLSIQIDSCEKEIESIDFEQKQVDKNIATISAKINQEKSNQADYENKVKDYLKELDSIKNKNSWILNIADNTWEAEVKTYEEKLSVINKKLSEIEERKYLTNLSEEYIKLGESIKNYHTVNQKRQQKYKGNNVNTEADQLQNEFTRLNNSIQNKESRNKEIAIEINQASELISKLKSTLSPLKEKYELTSEEQVENLLLSHESYKKIIAEKDKISSVSTEIKTLKLEWDAQHKKVESELKSLNKEDKKWLNQEIQDNESYVLELQGELQTINQEIGKSQALLQGDQEAQELHKSLSKKLNDKLKSNEKWILLNDLIGDSQGKKFANYAQDLTLVHLLVRANARLESLTDRYLLSFKPEEDDLQVIDKYQGDTIRAVKTLSGGETFLISLALALSLSDLASKNVRLESLFIDEGFGTLDQETLELAMITLEKLQTQGGKKIGIISHVESLKERINTKIQVHKNAQGYSTLEIVG